MMQGTAMRAWCAVYQWTGNDEFRIGTVLVPDAGTQQEVEAALGAEFTRVWGAILPDDVVRPRLVRLLPGSIFFVPESDRGTSNV